MHTNQLCYILELNVFATCCLKRITLLSSDTIDVFYASQERVVRKVDSAIYRTVIFSTAAERHKKHQARDVEFPRDSDFNSKMASTGK